LQVNREISRQILIRFEPQRNGFLTDYLSVPMNILAGYKFNRVSLTVIRTGEEIELKLVRKQLKKVRPFQTSRKIFLDLQNGLT
jgi:hypothetical protein